MMNVSETPQISVKGFVVFLFVVSGLLGISLKIQLDTAKNEA